MATTALINKLSEQINNSENNTTELENLNSFMSSVQSSCIADTNFVNNLLDSYKQVSNLLSPNTCSYQKSNFQYLGNLALGEWIDNLNFELPESLSTSMNMLNAGCSIFNGISNFIDTIKSFSLNLYKLTDILKSGCSACDYGNLHSLINQTTDYNFDLPDYFGNFGEYSINLLTLVYGDTEIVPFNELSENDFDLYITDTESDYYTIYDMGVRYGDELVDVQSTIINGLIQMAGDIASDEMKNNGFCSLSQYTDQATCEMNGGIWILNSSEFQFLPNTVNTFYADDKSGACIDEANFLDYLELKSTGKIYIRTNVPLPENCGELSIEGFEGDNPPYHWVLSKRTKNINDLSDSSIIKLSDIPSLIEKRNKIISDYNRYMINLETSYALYQDEYSKLQETNISEELFNEFDEFQRLYSIKPNNLTEKYNIIFQNIVGKLNWIIEAGVLASLNPDAIFTKEDGLTGLITKQFSLYSYKGIEDIHSHIRISTDVNYEYSFNKDIKEFYDEIALIDDYLIELHDKTIEAKYTYIQFEITNDTYSKFFTGKVVNGDYPGKTNNNSIRVSDPKYFLGYTKPHIEILRDVMNLNSMNIYHGDVWCDISDGKYVLWMYLRVATLTSGLFNYKWVQLNSEVNISYINNVIESYTVQIDTSLFFNFEEKSNTYFSDYDPSIDWNNEVQKWINVGDIWITKENTYTVQKIFSNVDGIFKWIDLSNNLPIIAPTKMILNEDTDIAGNLLTNFFDNIGSTLSLDMVFLPSTLGGVANSYEISETENNVFEVANLGTFGFKTNGDYTFKPFPNKYSGTLSYKFRAKNLDNNYSMGTFDVTINPINDAPLVSGPLSITYLTSDDKTTLNLLINSIDIDEDNLFVSNLELISGTDIRTSITRDYKNNILESTKELYIKPSEYIEELKRDEIKSFHFSYDVTDNKSFTPTSATINFRGINHPPIITNSTVELLTTNEVYNVDLNNFIYDYDGDEGLLTIDLIENDTYNAISTNEKTKIVTINPTVYNSYLTSGNTQNIRIAYSIDDTHGGISSGILNINITK